MDQPDHVPVESTPNPKYVRAPLAKPITPSPKSYVVAVCLAGVFGVVGIHHFYLRRWFEGALDFGLFVATIALFFMGHVGWAILVGVIDGLHTVIVTFMLLTGTFNDGDGKTVCYPGQRIR